MSKSALFGRRIHIAGSIAADPTVAPATDAQQARALVEQLVSELVIRGATLVVPIDADKVRDDGQPICFDWLMLKAAHDNLARRPAGAPHPLILAVEHHKTQDQIPPAYAALWDQLRGTDLVQIENVSHWNMASKRMEAQARWGDILLTLGGAEGVLYLANLYHDAGKPVVPLNEKLADPTQGSQRLFSTGLSSQHAPRLFRTTTQSAHAWMNRINFSNRTAVPERVRAILELLEALEPPRAFVVRLLNDQHADFPDVQNFFEAVVQPIIEGELGYRMTVVDGQQKFEHARIDQEIFAKLHRSRVVLADITGQRPNCFLELGYAFGRQLPTMVMAKDGSETPFDITTFAGLRWKTTGTLDECKQAFRVHWNAIQTRPPLVQMEPLIP
jgi:hypothetical protein